MARALPVDSSTSTITACSSGEFLDASILTGKPVRNFCTNNGGVDADDGAVRARHAAIRLVCRAARQNARVRGGNVRVGSHDGRNAAIQIPSHGDLFAGDLGVKVDEAHLDRGV